MQTESRKMAVPNKALRLSQLLQSELAEGKFLEGQRFLSTHEIARAYSVSPGTARKALVELVGRGYLESAERSGHYLRQKPGLINTPVLPDRRATKTPTAVMMVVGSSYPWGERLLDQYKASLEQACANEGWELLRVDNQADQIERAGKQKHLAGCLAYGLTRPLAAHIDPATIISWNSPWCDPAWSLLGPNREQASRLAFEHLWDLGHHRTALVRLTPIGNLAREGRGLVLGMRRAYASMGLDWHSRDVITVESGDGQEIEEKAAQGLYGRLVDRDVTGIYCIDWSIVTSLYRAAHRRGEVIGRHLSIIASGGHDLADLIDPPPARIYWRFTDYASTAVKALRRLEKGRPLPHRIWIPTFLREGASAGPLMTKED